MFNPTEMGRGDGVLEIVPAQVFVSDSSALINMGAVSNVLWADIATYLKSAPRSKQNTITVAEGSNIG